MLVLFVKILSLKILIIPNLDVVNINAYAIFGQNPSSISQDIDLKRNSDINQGL